VKLSRFSIIPIEEDHAPHSSPSGSGPNSNTNTVSSSSSLLSKGSGEEHGPLALTLKNLGDESLLTSLTPKSIEEECHSLSGTSTPSGQVTGRFHIENVPNYQDNNSQLPVPIRGMNGISESNAKALEAAVARIMTDYWAQHQSMNCHFRGSDPDLFSSSLSSGRSTYGNTCCKHCTESRLLVRLKDAETQTDAGTQCDMGVNTNPVEVSEKLSTSTLTTN
jgi:hypothetical protein